jgi:hypothetical protein
MLRIIQLTRDYSYRWRIERYFIEGMINKIGVVEVE